MGPRRVDRAESIKSAAVEVFAEHGYRATKVSMIVARAGVAQGTFYLYFEGKKQIFSAILTDFLDLVTAAVSTWDPGSLDSVEAYRQSLRDLAGIMIDLLLQHRDMARIFFGERLLADGEFAPQVREFYDGLSDLLTGFNRTMWDRGLLRELDFRVLAGGTIGMVEGHIRRTIVEPEEPASRESCLHVADEMIDHFLFGAAAGPSRQR